MPVEVLSCKEWKLKSDLTSLVLDTLLWYDGTDLGKSDIKTGLINEL
jgi:hypothetical protein